MEEGVEGSWTMREMEEVGKEAEERPRVRKGVTVKEVLERMVKWKEKRINGRGS